MDVPEMVERVAKAIFYAEWADAPGTATGDIWEGMQGSSKRKYLAMARAAIEAMMEPTERMKYVGGTKCEDMMFGGDPDYTGIIFTDMGTVYTTMLSEALSPSLKEQERT